MKTEQKRLLVIDDSLIFRETIELAGKKRGWQVHASDDRGRVTAWLAENKPDVVLLDWELHEQQPKTFAKLLQARGLTGNTLLLSAHIDEERQRFVEKYGLAGTRLKPLDLRRLEEEVRLHHHDERIFDMQALTDGMRLAIDILNADLTHTLWSNKHAQKEPLTHEQRLIMKWLRVEMEDDKRNCDNIRRIDWDGAKGRFLESTLYRLDNGAYGLVRDWRDEDRRPHDHEFLDLEEKNPTLESWLRAVARLLAQRYAISRFRVYKISPLPHTQGLEKRHEPLVVPKFQSGGGIESKAESWFQVGFQPRCIPYIGEALQSGYCPEPKFVADGEDYDSDCELPRIRYGERGTYRVLFPVHHPDSGKTVALLAMDRRLDHAEELRGFNKEVVELATRMASDEARVLSPQQWGLMKGLVEDVGRRVADWLAEDEKDRTVLWNESISRILIRTFADAQSSPEMIYDGISGICTALAEEWNREEKEGEKRISGHIRGSTPHSERNEKGAQVSSWCIVLVSDGQALVSNSQSWRVVAGWGEAYGECRANGGRMGIPHTVVAQGEPWKAALIQAFQSWSEKAEVIPCECLGEETRSRIGSWLAVPMRVEGKTQALMMVQSPHAHYFTRFHCQLMEQAAKRLLPLLAAALRETRARDAFTAAVMHEIKNESHAARMLLDRVQKKAGETEWAGDLIKVRHYLDELNGLGQNTLDIFRVGRGDRVRASENKEAGTTTLDKLIENAILGWRTLYKRTNLDKQVPEELAARRISVPHVQGFQRVLRVLLHNAFRHGQDWVRIAAQLEHGDKDDTRDGERIELTVTNGSYQDTVLALGKDPDSAADRPSDSPLVGGSLGLVVARQLTTEAGGILGTLQYMGKEDALGEARITLSWPVDVVV